MVTITLFEHGEVTTDLGYMETQVPITSVGIDKNLAHRARSGPSKQKSKPDFPALLATRLLGRSEGWAWEGDSLFDQDIGTISPAAPQLVRLPGCASLRLKPVTITAALRSQ